MIIFFVLITQRINFVNAYLFLQKADFANGTVQFEAIKTYSTNPVQVTDSIYSFVNKSYSVEVKDQDTECVLSDTITIPGYENIFTSFFTNINLLYSTQNYFYLFPQLKGIFFFSDPLSTLKSTIIYLISYISLEFWLNHFWL